MNKDLHNDMDDAFNSAYQQFEDDPSGDVWEKINTGLDKKDIAAYKKQSAGWKRLTFLLLLLLSGCLLYETGVLKTGSGHSKENRPVAINNIKEQDPAFVTTEQPSTTTSDDITTPGKTADTSSSHFSQESLFINGNNSPLMPTKDNNLSHKMIAKTREQKPNRVNEKVKPAAENEQMEITITSSAPGKNKKAWLPANQNLLTEKINNYSVGKNNAGERTFHLPDNIRLFHLPLIADSVSISTAAQNKKWNGPFKPYWTITGFASNEWANYRLESDQQTTTKIEQREVHDPSFSTGALLTRQFTPKWALQTGLVYSYTSIGISPQEIYAFNDPAGTVSYKYIASSGYGYLKAGFGVPPVVGDSLAATEAKHTLQHISVPVVIKYKFGRNKLSFIPGAGIAVNFQTSAKIVTEIKDASHRETISMDKLNGTRPFYLSFVADAELQYKLNNKTSLIFRPAFRYALSPITKNNVVETYPYSFGAGLGLSYRF